VRPLPTNSSLGEFTNVKTREMRLSAKPESKNFEGNRIARPMSLVNSEQEAPIELERNRGRRGGKNDRSRDRERQKKHADVRMPRSYAYSDGVNEFSCVRLRCAAL